MSRAVDRSRDLCLVPRCPAGWTLRPATERPMSPASRVSSPTSFRHTAASLAIASGASAKGVQSMLGHASAQMTLDRYGHLFPDELDAVADRVDAARAAQVLSPRCPEA